MHLKELRLSLGVVHRRRAVRSLQRVHGDIGGRQRSEGLESHGRSVARVRGLGGAAGGAQAAPVTVAVAGDPADGGALQIVSSCAGPSASHA